MVKILLALGACLGACVLFILWLIRRSPEGHEDARGFHYGSPDRPAAHQEKNDASGDRNRSLSVRSEPV
jgi:hypothetical protein